MRLTQGRISWKGVVPFLALVFTGAGAWASGTVELPLFGPEGFYRNAGAPGSVIRTFSAPSTQGAFLLRLDNGSPEGENQVSSDGLFSTRWNTVSSALQAQSIEATLPSFLPETQEKYRRIFTGLSDQLPAIYGSLPAPEFVKVEGNLAQYRIRRTQLWEGQPKALIYYVWYARDAQGLWKVQAY